MFKCLLISNNVDLHHPFIFISVKLHQMTLKYFLKNKNEKMTHRTQTEIIFSRIKRIKIKKKTLRTRKYPF